MTKKTLELFAKYVKKETKLSYDDFQKKLMDDELIHLQDAYELYYLDEQKAKEELVDADYFDLFNKIRNINYCTLQQVGYNGCGKGIFNLTAKRFIYHEQDNIQLQSKDIKKLLENEDNIVLNCSCWDVIKSPIQNHL